MALQAKYKEFLANPTADAFAGDASLNYVPTTTSLTGATAILKHIKVQQSMVEKRTENFLNVIEGANGLCIETETTLHFVQGGGVYLLNLDDNFVSDKTVTLPIVSQPGLFLSWYACRLTLPLDPHCHLQRRGEDSADSAPLGPSMPSEGSRDDWGTGPQLAHPRRQGTDQDDHVIGSRSAHPG